MAEQRKVVVLTESQAEQMGVTEYKFIVYVKQFLKALLDDPVNAKPSDVMELNGFDRKRLIDELLAIGMLEREESIRDKDENGNPTTAVMRVKFRIPRNGFDKNMRKLYDKLFPEEGQELNETDCGSIGGGGPNNFEMSAYVTTFGPIQRRGGGIDKEVYDRTPGEIITGKKKKRGKHKNA